MPRQKTRSTEPQYEETEVFAGYTFHIKSDEFGRRKAPSKYHEFGDMILDNLHLAVNGEGVLYMYRDGVYVEAEDELYLILHQMYVASEVDFNKTIDQQIVYYVTKEVTRFKIEEKPRPNMVNLRNGIWFIEEERFEPHEDQYKHWQYLSYIQLPIAYNPSCTCARTIKFLSEVFPGGEDLLVDILGSFLSSNTANHKAVVLLGGGNNGKSLFFNIVMSLVGEANYSTTSIHTLADPTQRFANYDIVGKLVNIGDDTPQASIADTANIKSIISGGSIKVEGKFKKAHSYRPFCKLIFACNNRISSDDPSVGYKRRFFNVPFQMKFSLDPVFEQQHIQIFSEENEKSGIFNEIAKRMYRTYKTSYDVPPAVAHIVETYEPYPEHLEDWLATNLVRLETSKIHAQTLTKAINYAFDRYGKKCFSVKKVARWVINKLGPYTNEAGEIVIDPNVKQSRPRVDGARDTWIHGVSVVDPSIYDYEGSDETGFSEDLEEEIESLREDT